MNYFAFHFVISPVLPGRDILLYELGEIGFESFEEKMDGLSAFVKAANLNETHLREIIEKYKSDFEIKFSKEEIEQKNWNAEWESNFHPIEVGTSCIIRAPFHQPEKKYEFEIVIQPQMSFGTGHHETTWLITKHLLAFPLKGLNVLDMGCGTGVLAILCKISGAKSVVAIDIDEWSYLNTIENAQLNNNTELIVEKGDASLLIGRHFNLILANINRNVLLSDMPAYCDALLEGGSIFFSGFFTTDVPVLSDRAAALGLIFVKSDSKNNWAMLEFKKP